MMNFIECFIVIEIKLVYTNNIFNFFYYYSKNIFYIFSFN